MVMICDFAVAGTLARDIQSNVKEITSREGRKVGGTRAPRGGGGGGAGGRSTRQGVPIP